MMPFVNTNVENHQLTLVSIAGPTPVSLALSPPGPITLGRGSHHTIELADSRVSRDHAVLTCVPAKLSTDPPRWLLSDSGSLHGTWLNGIRVESGQAVPVRPGSQIVIGPWTFRVQGDDRAPD